MSYYTLNTGKFRDFLKEIQRIRRPDKATYEWLAGLGYKSSNDRGFVRVLKQINFVQDDGTPTDYFRDYQDTTKSKETMSKAIKEGYKILYDTYPEAHNEDDTKLVNIFQTSLNVSEDTAKYAVTTYRILCEYSDLVVDKPSPATPSPLSPTPKLPTGGSEVQPLLTIKPEQLGELIQQKRELGVNINIQVTLPETTDAEVYEKIFAALKKHFFSE